MSRKQSIKELKKGGVFGYLAGPTPATTTYIGVSGEAVLAKDPRWDVQTIIDTNFDPEVFISTLELEDKTPLTQMLREAAAWGFYEALEEFHMFFKAFDRLPGYVDAPNDDYPAKYLLQSVEAPHDQK